jgi:hypothetical protein
MMKAAGSILVVLLTLLFVLSACFKWFFADSGQDQPAPLGLSLATIRVIGVVEVVCALIYVLPKTSVLGAILLTGYMGGAIAAHLHDGESPLPQIVIAILVWIGCALRQPEVFRIVWGGFSSRASDATRLDSESRDARR